MKRQIPSWIGWPLLAAWAYGVLYFWAQRSAYFPQKHPEGFWDVQSRLGAEDVWLRTADGVRLHGWWASGENPRVATLFLHGNAGNITHRADRVAEITGAGSSVLLLDYRGYGKSEGRPTEKGLYADADAGYRHLVGRGYPAGRIIVHGESLGTTVAVDLAARRPCGGVVLEAPFTSGSDVAARVLPVLGPLVMRSFDTIGKIGQVRTPLLILHGDRDEVIPFVMGEKLFQAANQPKQFWRLPGAGHNNLAAAAGPAYRKRLAEFYAFAAR